MLKRRLQRGYVHFLPLVEVFTVFAIVTPNQVNHQTEKL
jgi:hypothetical protein